MTVVSDSSPLIALARIQCLQLLPMLYRRIVLPTEVYDEVVVAGAGLAGAGQIAKAGWIDVCPVKDSAGLAEAVRQTGLGAGEISAVMLAKELRAGLTLIDERRARRYARGEGLEIIGCIGMLEILYRRGHLADLRDACSRLLAQEFRIHKGALQESLSRLKLPPL